MEEIVGNAIFTEEPTVACHLQGSGGGEGGMVTVKDVNLFSCCKGCMLPLKLRCHVSYIPAMGRVIGLSKLPRIGVSCARRLQSPFQFAQDFAREVTGSFGPLGVAVLVESWHVGYSSKNRNDFKENHKGQFGWQQIKCRGKESWSAITGEFTRLENGLWEEFLATLRKTPDSCQLILPDYAEPGSLSSDFCDEIGGFCETNSNVNSDCRNKSLDKLVLAAKVLVRMVSEKLEEKKVESTARGYVQQLVAATIGLSISQEVLLKEILTASSKVFINGEANRAESQQNGEFSHEIPSSLGNGVSKFVLKSFLDLPFSSLCEHHLLPFFGHVHVACALSSRFSFRLLDHHLEKLIFMFGRRPQVQERLTRQIAEAVAVLVGKSKSFDNSLVNGQNGTRHGIENGQHNGNGTANGGHNGFQNGHYLSDGSFGVMVVIQATHLCVASRGVEKTKSTTSTVATLGCFALCSKMRTAFLSTLPSEDYP